MTIREKLTEHLAEPTTLNMVRESDNTQLILIANPEGQGTTLVFTNLDSWKSKSKHSELCVGMVSAV